MIKMNNKPKKYTSTLIVRTNPELKHAFTTAQAINKDKFTEFLIKACNKFISKYSTINHVIHDEINDHVIHDEINDHVIHDENDHVIHDENDHVIHDDDAVHDEINLSESEINDLLIYSEPKPDYKAKIKEFKRLRIKMQSNSLYEEVFGQPTTEVGGMEALFND
jgi:hypothetical protein